MNIDAKMVENLAHLAKLRFDDAEKNLSGPTWRKWWRL
jgi:Asp-tRNA(Asn)/Glu-tRNA(Gln) amidotransferase C subunit